MARIKAEKLKQAEFLTNRLKLEDAPQKRLADGLVASRGSTRAATGLTNTPGECDSNVPPKANLYVNLYGEPSWTKAMGA